MSGPRSMAAAEYLELRGWTVDEEWWKDPTRNTLADGDVALTIQRARDAEDERKAWVAFAAAGRAWLATYTGDTMSRSVRLDPAGTAEHADEMLAEYRARFAVEVAS